MGNSKLIQKQRPEFKNTPCIHLSSTSQSCLISLPFSQWTILKQIPDIVLFHLLVLQYVFLKMGLFLKNYHNRNIFIVSLLNTSLIKHLVSVQFPHLVPKYAFYSQSECTWLAYLLGGFICKCHHMSQRIREPIWPNHSARVGMLSLHRAKQLTFSASLISASECHSLTTPPHCS